ncbi:LPS export ABC transporter permease LptG [Fodinicurvata sp. EGI_FJ10296]|uniref:LPS export ABC transporter permease LptG n=1 Tax=Fodinicurvata sp. EGI_FJ10296 TaxID=3231908 RepID=UPI00345563C6
MMPNRVLFKYIVRQFLTWFAAIMAILLGIILMFEYVEMLRRGADRPDITMGVALRLSVLKMPEVVELVFPFAVMFGAMFTFWRMNRSSELVVIRSAGLSVWQFTLPVIAAAALLGAAMIAVLNPLSATMLAMYEEEEAQWFSGRETVLDISGGGLWLRQRDDDGTSVIFARVLDGPGISLNDVTFFLYNDSEAFETRIDAMSADLGDNEWRLQNAYVLEGAGRPTVHETLTVPTTLTAGWIENSFASARTISFWTLPDFIETMESAGFSARSHRLRFQSLLSQPVLFSAMVLFAAVFSLRQTRRGGALAMSVAGIVTGFLVFVFSDIVRALGAAENLPILLAAWAPAFSTLLLGAATLLYIEDG